MNGDYDIRMFAYHYVFIVADGRTCIFVSGCVEGSGRDDGSDFDWTFILDKNTFMQHVIF